jgi:photosystem II stability/assembly factor-like uncharacterized protein
MDGVADPDEEQLERDLRRALRAPGYRLPDRLVPLERVHKGAVRRRRQHQALAASFAALTVIGLGLGVAHPWVNGDKDGGAAPVAAPSTGLTSAPSAKAQATPSAGEVSISPSPDTSASIIGPGPLTATLQKAILSHVQAATSVTAIDAKRWWVAAAISDCDCSSVVLSTSDGGKTFSVVSAFASSGLGNNVDVLRYLDARRASTLSTGKAGSKGELQDSADGGKTWTSPVSASSFVGLEAGGGKIAWALEDTGTAYHLWANAGSGWRDIATLPGHSPSPRPLPVMTVEGNKAVVVWGDASYHFHSASYDSSGATTGPHPVGGCAGELGLESLSAGLNGVWLSCATGSLDLVMRTTDLGSTWQTVDVKGRHGQHHALGAIDGTHAAVATVDGLYVIDTAGSLTAAQLPPGVDGSFVNYLGFTDTHDGFAITDSGQLLRSPDGGLRWSLVTY